jgi:hypothetical protein
MATHQVFGQLETVVGGLPDDYPGKDGYMLWIADARAKYATPPTDVDEYIKGLKAAGTALRGKMAVPAVPAAAPVMAAVAAAPAGAAAVPGAGAADAAPGAEAAAAGPILPLGSVQNQSLLGSNLGTTEPLPGAAPPPAASEGAAETAVDIGVAPPPAPAAASAAPPAEADAAASLGELDGSAFANGQRGTPRARPSSAGRRTHHQTPKRRRSAKKGRKGLSKKKTGSRK